jgi:hypothetical protein
LQGEFQTGYTVKTGFALGQGTARTHPAAIIWEGSEINDLNLSLLMVVGEFHDVPIVSQFRNPSELLFAIEMIHDWCLPPGILPAQTATYLETVVVRVGNGQRFWFYRRGVISQIVVRWKPPWDVATGLPLAAEVDLTIKMHLSTTTVAGKDFLTNYRYAPHRPWKFGKLWG